MPACPSAVRGELVFIVQGKPREPEGIVKVSKETRKDVGDGRVYTVEEFALTIINGAR